ncbi:MAG TPA: dTDP-4-amino-4,6-dideoxygalactose transaminase [Burkholderiaceae bacterium]|jgi:dTDP-4-amino-4,6-dideoxygalactose transaminase|nr:dTDP-4-amino-4,6-dideoxygalactose transaminase [Burkholderiaceae bacterium]
MEPFNRPYMTGREFVYIAEAHANGMLAGDGPFTKHCHEHLEKQFGVHTALLTHSCTAALELSALLARIEPGDEVIMPSYTFTSTANAFVLRGGVPVFVDIRPDTLNLDEKLVEGAITPRTKAIVPVHYAGVACEMDTLLDIARRHRLMVIEDAAQGVGSTYHGKPLGSIGDLGCLSFHETKNVISGEGGALLTNDEALAARAEIIREKGTNRSAFFRGQVDKYTWVDVGSSYLPGELIAAFLWAQLQQGDDITRRRLGIWRHYHEALAPLEERGWLRRPIVPEGCVHNAHMYYVLLPSLAARQEVIRRMRERNVSPVFHYVPLHSAPAGQRFARTATPMTHTDTLSERLLRLPLWIGVDRDLVIDTFHAACAEVCGSR